MQQLYNAVDMYLVKRFYQAREWNLSMTQTGTKGDTIQWEIRLNDMKTNIYVPSERDGFFQRNGSLYAPVLLAIPPVKGGSILNASVGASKLTDFSGYNKGAVTFKTPLMELLLQKGGDITNLWDWAYLPLHVAIVELVNLKAYTAALRSQAPGYTGIDGIARSVHALINAYLRYLSDGDDPSLLGEDEDLSAINAIDKEGIVVFDPIITQVNLSVDENTPIDFMTTSQSKPITIARLKDGVELDESGVRLKGKPTFPYCKWRRGIVGVINDDPRRVIVSRSCARALRLKSPDDPYVVTEHHIDIDTVSLPGVRITHPLTYEDGIVISKTMARKLGAFKHYVQRVVVRKDALVSIAKSPLELDVAPRDLFAIVEKICTDREKNESPYVVYPNTVIMVTSVKNATTGETEHVEVRARVNTKSVLVNYTIDEFVNDFGLEMMQISFKYVTYLPAQVGDKVADLHGNKSTIAAIWDDYKMPLWSNGDKVVRVHYMASPWVGKRLALGAAIEDAFAFKGFCENSQIVINSDERLRLDDVYETIPFDSMCGNLSGSVKAEAVPLSVRRIARLDNNVAEQLTIYRGIQFDEDLNIVSSNPKLWTEMPIFMVKGCQEILEFFVNESRVGERVKRLEGIMNAIERKLPAGAKTFAINKRIQKSYFSNVGWDVDWKEFENTSCDRRLKDGWYGIVKAGRNTVIVPPHDPIVRSSHGTYHISKIAIEANRVVADADSSAKGYAIMVESTVSRYLDFLANMLNGKDGMVRDILSVRAPYAIRSVVVNSGYHDPNTVFVPKHALKVLMKDERFRASYGNSDVLEAIIKRDPVHYEQHVIAVKVKGWDEDAIGVNPVLISELDGDYDGDTVVVMFPLIRNNIWNLKLTAANNLAKPIKGVDINYAWLALEHRAGKSSHFLAFHKDDEIKNQELYAMLKEGICTPEQYLKAVKDFRTIKDGTALTGALGLSIIFSTPVADKERLRNAMELYHKLAQDTLDAKCGGNTPSLDIFLATTVEFDENKIAARASEIGLNTLQIEILIEWMRKLMTSKKSKEKPTPPVYSVTQKSAKFVDVKRALQYIRSGSVGATALEHVVHSVRTKDTRANEGTTNE